MKLPFSLKRRKKGDDEDDDDLELEEEEPEEEGDDAYGDDDDDDEEGGGRRMDPHRKILIIAAVAGGLLFTSIIGGAAWFLLGSHEPKHVEAGPTVRPDGSVAIPEAAAPGGALSPPEGGTPAAEQAAEGAPQGGAPGKKSKSAPPTVPQEQVVAGVSASQVAVQAAGKSVLGGNAQAQQGADVGRVVPFAMQDAYKDIAFIDGVEGLARVPDPALVEKMSDGRVLPAVGRNGTRPMDAYARPIGSVDASVPQVAVLIRGIGLSRAASLAAIRALPPEVSMVIDPYARDPSDWVVRARLAGHEVFIGLPMESANFPFEDAGPMALNTQRQLDQNMAVLTDLMALVPGYVGMVSKFGSKFGVAEGQLKPLFESMRDRGIMFVDSGESGSGAMTRIATEAKLPRALVNIQLDATPTSHEVHAKLARLGALARSQAVAVAMGDPYPTTIRELKKWLATQSDKLRLVPVSAVANRQITP